MYGIFCPSTPPKFRNTLLSLKLNSQRTVKTRYLLKVFERVYIHKIVDEVHIIYMAFKECKVEISQTWRGELF